MDDRRIPRHGYKVLNDVGVEIGVVTSGTQSPSLNLAIGLAYVPVENAKIGSSLQINMGSRNATAHVVKIPFIKS